MTEGARHLSGSTTEKKTASLGGGLRGLSSLPTTPAQWEALDRAAWDAIKGWPESAGVDPHVHGLDFAALTRWFLWDKVGRAIRAEIYPEGFAEEARIQGWREVPRRATAGSLIADPGGFGLDAVGTDDSIAARADHSSPHVFIPVPTPRIAKAVEGLHRSGRAVLSAPLTHYKLPNTELIPYPCNTGEPDERFAEWLSSAIVAGLAAQGIALLKPDAALLRSQIAKQTVQLRAARIFLESIKPDVLILHADNHPTPQHYALLGRQLGILVLMLQHGLDCERHYLDDSYSDFIAAWGRERAQRYRTSSAHQPEEIRVTGNPEYDDLPVEDEPYAGGRTALWVTRPHSSDKCYAPSRSPLEGIELARAVINAARDAGLRLVIKPHPADIADELQRCIEQEGAGDFVAISVQPPLLLAQRARLVISEDSTAGLEAMFHGKPLVHAHFAPTPPTVDFTGYGAALAGFTPESLREAVLHAAQLSAAEKDRMMEDQHTFMRDFAEMPGGGATKRTLRFIEDVIRETASG